MSKVKDWIIQEQGKHFCKCGCGGEIKIISSHYTYGIPNVIRGHTTEETRKKLSLNSSHHSLTDEHKEILRQYQLGRKLSDETIKKRQNSRGEYAKGNDHHMIGKHHTTETIEKICKTKNNPTWKKLNSGSNHKLWKGGLNRRLEYLDLNPIFINKKFKNSNGHHIDNKYIIYLPKELHSKNISKYNSHDQRTGKGMLKMNTKAFNYVWTHQEDLLITVDELYSIEINTLNYWKNK